MSKLALMSLSMLVCSSALADEGVPPLPSVSLSAVSSAARVDDVDVPRRGQLIERHGFYGAPTFGVTMLDRMGAPTVGMRSAWLANDTVGVGFALNAVANHVKEDIGYAGRGVSFYGGLLLEYLIAADRPLHGFLDATIGPGVICQQTGRDGDEDCVGHSFFAFEPTANLQLNVSSAMRVSVGAGYRLAVGSEGSPLTNRELGGFVSRAALQFGKF